MPSLLDASVVEFLRTSKVGKTFPVGQLMPGLSDANVTAELVEKSPKYWEFDLTYHGVFIGRTFIEKLPSGKYELGDL